MAARSSPHAAPRRRRFMLAPLILGVGVFLALGAYQLTLPGLHYDEAREAGLNAMQLVIGQPVTAFRDTTVQVGPWQMPLMVQDYIGALNVYLALPFLSLGGINVAALRWLSLLTGALTIVLAWRIADRLGGPIAAIVTVMLLAVSPTFVFWSRQGIFVTNLTALLFMAGLLSGLRWWSRRRRRDLWLTAFILGLGVYAKLLFVWAIGSLAVVALADHQITRGRRGLPVVTAKEGATTARGDEDNVSRRGRPTALGTWLVALVCFLAPLLPLILFNVRTGGTLTSVFGNLGQSYYGVNNAAYFPNLLVRVQQLRTVLRGDQFWYLGELFANQWAPWLISGLIVAASLQALLSRRRLMRNLNSQSGPAAASDGRAFAFLLPLALLFLFVAQSAFTVSDLFVTHLALIYPLIPLAAGLAVASLVRGQWGRNRQSDSPASAVVPGPEANRRRPRFFAVLLTTVIVCAPIAAATWWFAADLWTTIQYHKVLSISGGYSDHSDAIYALAARLDRDGLGAPLALDWGLSAPVRFLTVGRVNPVEVFGYDRLDAPDAGFTERLSGFLDNPDNVYLAHMPDVTIFRGRVDALKVLAQARGLALQEEGRFSERNGRPLFVLYRAAPAVEGE